jgi:hypothetical protein
MALTRKDLGDLYERLRRVEMYADIWGTLGSNWRKWEDELADLDRLTTLFVDSERTPR